jgi:hypothetical protein
VQPGKIGPQYGSPVSNGGTGYYNDHQGPGSPHSAIPPGTLPTGFVQELAPNGKMELVNTLAHYFPTISTMNSTISNPQMNLVAAPNHTSSFGSIVGNALNNFDAIEGAIVAGLSPLMGLAKLGNHWLSKLFGTTGVASVPDTSGRASWLDSNGHRHYGTKNELDRAKERGDVSSEAAAPQGIDKGYENDVRPILLDLDGNGIKLTELSNSTTFTDTSGDGLKHRTAWAGAGDGVLFIDADGNGALSNSPEYVFTEWAAGSANDLDALRRAYDTNGDGKLTSADTRGAEFRGQGANPWRLHAPPRRRRANRTQASRPFLTAFSSRRRIQSSQSPSSVAMMRSDTIGMRSAFQGSQTWASNASTWAR